MQSSSVRLSRSISNPLDVVEEVVSVKEWVFDRRSSEEMAVEVPGTWCDFGLFFAWSEDLSALHFSCALDMRVQTKVLGQIYELVAKLNERLWMGHFAVWVEEGIPMFRHTMRVTNAKLMGDQIEYLVDLAVQECERYYPAFQFVIWGGRSAEDAIACSLLDTMGEA